MPMLKLKNTPARDSDLATEIAFSIREYGEKVLSESKFIHQEDAKSLESAIEEIPTLFLALSTAIRTAYPYNDSKSEAAFHCLAKLMLETFSVGSAAVHSKEADAHKKKLNAFIMRLLREEKSKNDPREKAIAAAILQQVEHLADRNGLSNYKLAESILDKINESLTKDRFDGIKVDKLRRTLDKMLGPTPQHA